MGWGRSRGARLAGVGVYASRRAASQGASRCRGASFRGHSTYQTTTPDENFLPPTGRATLTQRPAGLARMGRPASKNSWVPVRPPHEARRRHAGDGDSRCRLCESLPLCPAGAAIARARGTRTHEQGVAPARAGGAEAGPPGNPRRRSHETKNPGGTGVSLVRDLVRAAFQLFAFPLFSKYARQELNL